VIFSTRLDRLWGSSSIVSNGYRVFTGGRTAAAWS